MSLWDPYKLKDLPEEQRGEVTKKLIEEVEKTKRERLEHQEMPIALIIGTAVVLVAGLTFSYCSVQEWKEVRLESIKAQAPAPMVCPPATLPTFDLSLPASIRLTPVDGGK